MTSMIEIDGLLIPIECESQADYSLSQEYSETVMASGVRYAPRAPKPNMDWTLLWDASDPEEYALLMGLAHGEFKGSTIRIVDATAAATNTLSAHVSLLKHFDGNPLPSVTMSGPVMLEGGRMAGRSLINIEAGVNVTPGSAFSSLSPGGGKRVTLSVYAAAGTSGSIRLRPLWYQSTGPSVVGPTATLEARTLADGSLKRVSTTVLVPNSITPSGLSSGPVTRVGMSAFDATQLAHPAISWTSWMTEWGVGGSPRQVRLMPPDLSTILAAREARGTRASTVRVSVREVGLP